MLGIKARRDTSARTTPGLGRALRRRAIASAAFGAALAALIVTPLAANASGHTCSSNNICYYNNIGFAADSPTKQVPSNPWSAVSGNYPNLDGGASPHTYNNPDSCNNAYAFWAICNENDTITSVKNTSSTRALRLFNNASYSGGFQTLYALNSVSQVNYNDQISSFCWNDGTAGVSACSF